MTDQERKKAFSNNLLKILEEREKSQVEVANAIGVSQQTFNTWCRGVALPRMGKIQLLADYFHVNMSELIESGSAASASGTAASVSSIDSKKNWLNHLYDELDQKNKEALLTRADELFKLQQLAAHEKEIERRSFTVSDAEGIA